MPRAIRMTRSRSTILIGVLLMHAGCVVESGSSDDNRGGTASTCPEASGGRVEAPPSAGGGSSGIGIGGRGPSNGGSSSVGSVVTVLGEADYDTLCRGTQSAGFAIGCQDVYETNYVSSCIASWEALASNCPQEADALAHCWMVQELLEYACDSERRVKLADGVCMEEFANVEGCPR